MVTRSLRGTFNDQRFLYNLHEGVNTLKPFFGNIFYRCDVARSTLIDSIVNKYKEAIDEYRNLIEGDEEPDEDEIFNVVQSLKKVSIFYSCHNMNPWGIWDSLYKDIEDAKDPSKYYFLLSSLSLTGRYNV